MDSLDTHRKWQTKLCVKPGDRVSGGTIIAEVPETPAIVHKVMVPPDVEGIVETVVPDGEYTINDTIVTLLLKDDSVKELTMTQKWPIRIPRPNQKRHPASRPLVTGQRILDTLFPIAKGGTAAIPGGFGTGKTLSLIHICCHKNAISAGANVAVTVSEYSFGGGVRAVIAKRCLLYTSRCV